MSVFSKLGSGVAIFAASALVLSGCAADAEAPAPETTDTGGTSMPAETLNLKVGTILPQTGSLAFLGPPEEAGVMLAAQEINDANMGITIDVTYGDSGDLANLAYETEVPRVLAAGVTAIIGAASSGVSLAFIDDVTKEAGVLQFSPANTSPAFSTRDNNGLYFRAAPSDALQGEVLGDELAADGHESISMIVLNDAYGNGLADATQARFESNGGEVLARPNFNQGDTTFSSQIAEIVASNPDAVVVITFDEANSIVPELLNSFSAEQLYFVDGNLADYSEVFPAGALEGAKGTAPGAKDDPVELVARADAAWQAAGNDPLDSNLYLAESYDATMAIALAALMAGSVESRDIANALPSVTGTNGGDTCFTFAECATLIAGGATAITHSGGTGPLGLQANGDRARATINLFQYDANNQIGDPINQFSF